MRLIDPKMSIDTIKSYIEVWDCKGCLPYGETQHNVMAVDDLQYLPTIEAEPVRHGRWIDKGEYAVCTECGGRSGTQYDGVEPIALMARFCQNCGARMDGGADNG